MVGDKSEWVLAPDNDTRLQLIEKILDANLLFKGLYDGTITTSIRSTLCDTCRTWYSKFVVRMFGCYKTTCRGDVNVFVAHHKSYKAKAADVVMKSNLDARGLVMAVGFPRNCSHGTDLPSE